MCSSSFGCRGDQAAARSSESGFIFVISRSTGWLARVLALLSLYFQSLRFVMTASLAGVKPITVADFLLWFHRILHLHFELLLFLFDQLGTKSSIKPWVRDGPRRNRLITAYSFGHPQSCGFLCI